MVPLAGFRCNYLTPYRRVSPDTQASEGAVLLQFSLDIALLGRMAGMPQVRHFAIVAVAALTARTTRAWLAEPDHRCTVPP